MQIFIIIIIIISFFFFFLLLLGSYTGLGVLAICTRKMKTDQLVAINKVGNFALETWGTSHGAQLQVSTRN
jgi:cytochrome bd-type quinol oxidase subunit 2